MPDIVANLRVDQAWGSAQIMGALHQVGGRYNYRRTVLTADCGGSCATTSQAVRLSRRRVGLGGRRRYDLEDAVGCQGHALRSDRVCRRCQPVRRLRAGQQLACTSRASRSGLNDAAGVLAIRHGRWSAGSRADQDLGRHASRSSITGPQACAPRGSPVTWTSSTTTMQRQLLAAAVCAGRLLQHPAVGSDCRSTNCNPDWSTVSLASRTMWNPVANLDVGLEVAYTKVNTAYRWDGELDRAPRTLAGRHLHIEDQDRLDCHDACAAQLLAVI